MIKRRQRRLDTVNGEGALLRFGHVLAGVLFLPTNLYLLWRHSNAATMAVIFGNSGSGLGVNNDLLRHGGLSGTQDEDVIAGYIDIKPSTWSPPSVATVDEIDVELHEHLHSRLPLEYGVIEHLRRDASS